MGSSAPGGAWSKPEELTPPGGDHFRTAIGEDRAGRIWVVWSSQVSGNFDLYACAFDGQRWSATQRLTTAEPDRGMVEVAVASLKSVLRREQPEQVPEAEAVVVTV